MERSLTVEERIRRAEEIYEKRKQGENRPVAKVNVNDVENKKDIKLLKKMLIQLCISVMIYLIVYFINNNQYVFSNDFTQKVNDILSYDTNFVELYNNAKGWISQFFSESQEEVAPENSIGGAEENTQEQQNQAPVQENANVTDLSQEEQDIINVKNTTSFIKPIEGTISSPFGYRSEATGRVPKNHTGVDIAANLGTKIKSATDGEVVLSSEEGDYRQAPKNSNRRS